LGKKDYIGEQLVWNVPYQAGELKVIAYNNNQIAAEKVFKSASKPSTFTVTTDKKSIRPNQKDIIHVEIDITDKEGNFCPLASDLINVEVTGAAKLLAIDNGDPIELSRYQINSKKAFRGKCLLILQATDKKGAINVTLKAKGLEPKTIHFESN
jgi:beta-galactosidase